MDFRQILNEYAYTTELHAHTTPVSRCGKKTPAELIEVYEGVGCDTVTVTNHLGEDHLETDELTNNSRIIFHECRQAMGNISASEFYLSAYYEAIKAAEGKNINVVLGAEIRFSGTNNDYLVYGICPDDIEKIMHYIPFGIEEFYTKFIKGSKAMVLHAHPFRKNMEPTPLGFVDGIETFNTHPGQNSAIGLATRFAREHNLTVCGGSDYHEEGRHATCLMRTKTRIRDSYDIADAIKSRDIVFDMSGHIVIPYLY